MSIDVFLSYAHDDWAARGGFSRSRLESCIELLRDRLGMNSAHGHFNLIQDTLGAVRHGERLDEELQRTIDRSHMHLLAITESYVASPYCAMEFDRIIESGRPYFPLLMQDVEEAIENGRAADGWAERLRKTSDVVSCVLWGPCKERVGKVCEYAHPTQQFDRRNGELFTDRLQDLARDIKGQARASAPGHVDSIDIPEGELDVVIAQPTSDVSGIAEEFEKQLLRRNCVVVRLELQRMSPEQIDDALSRARIFVQLLGTMPGEPIDNVAATRWQYECAARHDVRRCIWRDSRCKLSELDAGFRDFVEGAGYFDQSISDFEEWVLCELAEIQRFEMWYRNSVDDEGTPRIAIDADREDRDFSELVHQDIKYDANVVHIPYSGGDMEELMKQVATTYDGVILIYGPSEPGQFRCLNHLDVYEQARALARIRARAVAAQIAVAHSDEASAPPPPEGPSIFVLKMDGNQMDQGRKRHYIDTLRARPKGAPATAGAVAAATAP